MKIDTKSLVSMTEANQNFSKVARLVDETGAALILKNNKPRYLIVEYNEVDDLSLVEDEELELVSKALIDKNKRVYRELAK